MIHKTDIYKKDIKSYIFKIRHWKKIHKKDTLKWCINEVQNVMQMELKNYKQKNMSIKRIKGEKKVKFYKLSIKKDFKL